MKPARTLDPQPLAWHTAALSAGAPSCQLAPSTVSVGIATRIRLYRPPAASPPANRTTARTWSASRASRGPAEQGAAWVAQTTLGAVTFRFAPRRERGLEVLDHGMWSCHRSPSTATMRDPSGAGRRREMLFTLLRYHPGAPGETVPASGHGYWCGQT